MKGLIVLLLIALMCGGTAVAKDKAKPKITGAFWQLHSGFFGRGEAYFEEQVELMHKAGIDTIIIQDTAGDNSATYARSDQVKIKVDGPFAPGTYELLVRKLPVTISEIKSDAQLSYEIVSPEPSPFLGDFGYKLLDGDYSIYGSVGWLEDGESTEVRINIELKDTANYLDIHFLTLNGNIEREEVLFAGKTGMLTLVNDELTQILEAAEKRGMSVWLGTKFSGTWWGDDFDGGKEIEDNIKTAEALERYYGHYKCFVGYYIPHEFRPDWRPQYNIQFYKELAERLKAYNKPIAIAPFFRVEMPFAAHEKFWREFLQEVDIDVLMLQDGVGSDTKRIDKILPHYEMVQKVAKENGIEFWSDLEVFHVEVQDGPAQPADIKKVTRQLETQAPYVDRIVIFDWLHYMSPLAGDKAKALYEGYLEYLGGE